MKLKKILIIAFIIILIICAGTYIDYFIAKTNNVAPKIVIKEELNENITVYKGIMYKVWYCKTNQTHIFGSYSDKDAICPKDYKYVDGYYTNVFGIKISKRNIELLTNDGIYTSEMIENMNSESQVENAVYVSYNYGKSKYKILQDKKSSDNNKLIIFPEFKEENGKYKWIYDEESTKYCLKDSNQIAIYENNKCGIFEEIKMDQKWCSNYENSTLIYDDNVSSLCEE